MRTRILLPLGAALGVSLAAMGLSPNAQAIVVAYYDFPPAQGTTFPSASTDTDPNSTAGSLSMGTGFSTTGGNNSGITSFATSGNPPNALFLRPTNSSLESDAISGSKYITFTITPNVGTLSLTSLNLDYRRDSATAATNLSLRSSVNGFGSPLATASLSGVSTTGFSQLSLDLSSVAVLQNLPESVPVTFRLYLWGATAADALTRFDNIALNAIPEPTSWSFVIGVFGVLMVHRRGRKFHSR